MGPRGRHADPGCRPKVQPMSALRLRLPGPRHHTNGCLPGMRRRRNMRPHSLSTPPAACDGARGRAAAVPGAAGGRRGRGPGVLHGACAHRGGEDAHADRWDARVAHAARSAPLGGLPPVVGVVGQSVACGARAACKVVARLRPAACALAQLGDLPGGARPWLQHRRRPSCTLLRFVGAPPSFTRRRVHPCVDRADDHPAGRGAARHLCGLRLLPAA